MEGERIWRWSGIIIILYILKEGECVYQKNQPLPRAVWTDFISVLEKFNIFPIAIPNFDRTSESDVDMYCNTMFLRYCPFVLVRGCSHSKILGIWRTTLPWLALLAVPLRVLANFARAVARTLSLAPEDWLGVCNPQTLVAVFHACAAFSGLCISFSFRKIPSSLFLYVVLISSCHTIFSIRFFQLKTKILRLTDFLLRRLHRFLTFSFQLWHTFHKFNLRSSSFEISSRVRTCVRRWFSSVWNHWNTWKNILELRTGNLTILFPNSLRVPLYFRQLRLFLTYTQLSSNTIPSELMFCFLFVLQRLMLSSCRFPPHSEHRRHRSSRRNLFVLSRKSLVPNHWLVHHYYHFAVYILQDTTPFPLQVRSIRSHVEAPI